MDSIHFLNLQEHLLIIICEHLPLKDLKSLMLASRYLNHLVCNTQKLMARISISWNSNMDHLLIVRSNRKYKSLKLDLSEANMGTSLFLFRTFAPSLEEVEVYNKYVIGSDFLRLLTHLADSSKVKVFTISNIILQPQFKYSIENFVVIQSLEELIFKNSDCRLLEHFKGMQLKSFTYDNSNICFSHLEAPGSFLESQRNLKHLKLSFGMIRETFNKDMSKKFLFKLQELEMSLEYMTDKEARNINLFLREQEATLKSLKVFIIAGNLHAVAIMLKNVNVRNIYLELKSFILNEGFVIENLASVAHLVLNTNNAENQLSVMQLKTFPNVTELTLCRHEIKAPHMDALINNFPKLTKLNFVNAHASAVETIKTLTEVTFHNVDFKFVHVFLKLNRKVTSLKVSGYQLVHDGYLMVILRRYKNVKHIDFSGIEMWYPTDYICTKTLSYNAKDLTSIVLPRSMKKNNYALRELELAIIIKYA